jgi:hypothetical protein
MTIQEIEKKCGRQLPAAYVEFLATIGDFAEYWFRDDPDDPDDPGRCWWLFGIDRLQNELDMIGVGKAPAYSSLRLYTACYREASGASVVYASGGDELPIDRVAGGFVIGDENGDPLYLDPSDGFSVWTYCHDGANVRKLARSFEEWIKQATPA